MLNIGLLGLVQFLQNCYYDYFHFFPSDIYVMTVILSYYPAMSCAWFVFPGNGEGCFVSLHEFKGHCIARFGVIGQFLRENL